MHSSVFSFIHETRFLACFSGNDIAKGGRQPCENEKRWQHSDPGTNAHWVCGSA